MDRYTILNKVNYPSDVKKLTSAELSALCAEIREFLTHSISRTGGHLASNLGVVEIPQTMLETTVNATMNDPGKLKNYPFPITADAMRAMAN